MCFKICGTLDKGRRGLEKNDDSRKIQNLKKAIDYAKENIPDGISYDTVNRIHKILLDSVRGEEKSPGKIRETQNWIGHPGYTIENATFLPPPGTGEGICVVAELI